MIEKTSSGMQLTTPYLDNVMSPVHRDASILDWFNRYLQHEVSGGSPNTFAAKEHDLQRFLDFYAHTLRSDDIDLWTTSITRGFITWMQRDANRGKPYAAATVNRAIATLRHCVRWIHRNYPFPGGDPFEGIQDLHTDDPPALGLSDIEIMRIRSASEQLLRLNTRRNQLPWRNHAILMILLRTGLRVSELITLEFEQYEGKHFHNVKRKGRKISKKVFLPEEARSALHNYLEQERGHDPGPLFCSTRGKPIARQHVDRMLKQVAAFVNARLPSDDHIQLHAHLLRHTILKRAADKHGVHYAQELSGNVGQQHVWRYVQPPEAAKEQAVEDLF